MAKLAVLAAALLVAMAAATIPSAQGARTLESVERVTILEASLVAKAPSSSTVLDVAPAPLGAFDVPFEVAAAADGPAAAGYRATDCDHKVPVYGP